MDSKADACPLDVSVIQITLGEMMGKLEDGIRAYTEGRRDEARKYFVAIAKENPQDENIWGWLYKVSNTDDERIKCLNRLLKINPRNMKALKLLREIENKNVPTPVVQQPVENKPIQTQQQNKNLLIGIIAIFSACFICFCVLWFWPSPEPEKDYKTASYIICQLYVEDNLKSPSTAKFAGSVNSSISDLGNNTYETYSYVDAQNSFGAEIRTNFYCKIQYIGTPEGDEYLTSNWKLLDLKFLE